MASGATGVYGLPYPLQTDPVDVSLDIQLLATAVETEILLKSPIESPSFTGNPTAPTPNNSDNDTSIATTAFVKNQGYAQLSGATFTGTVNLASNFSVTGGSIELGRVDSVASTPYIDFHAGATVVDYDARISVSSPTGSIGQATLNLLAQTVSTTGKFSGTGSIEIVSSTTRPSSPVEGRVIYETDTDKLMLWNGTAWIPASGAATYAATSPSNPSTGSLWVDSDNLETFVYNGSAWVSTINPFVVSKVTGDGITNIVALTQAQYDALATKNGTTLYVITT